MTEKAIVFGGSGFMGSHVADCLSDIGFETTIFDINYSPWLKDGQNMIVGSIQDSEKVFKAIRGMDYVYNFAALADLNKALNSPRESVDINILGNLNILEGCRKTKVKRFIYASTVYVFSREGGFYRCSKQAAESYVTEYQKTYGLDYTILRYGSLYGPRADLSNGILRIVKDAIEEGRLYYDGNKEATREYIHVQDAARASIEILGKEFQNQSVVLTGHEPMKVVDMLKMIGEMLGLSENAIEFSEEENIGHYIRTPYAYQPNIGRKYIPQMHVDLGQGLLQVINEIRND